MLIVVHKNEYRLKVSHMKVMNVVFVVVGYSGIILFMGSAVERRRYIVTSSLIGWAHIQNGPWVLTQHWGNQTVDESVYMNRMREQYDISKLKHSTAKLRPYSMGYTAKDGSEWEGGLLFFGYCNVLMSCHLEQVWHGYRVYVPSYETYYEPCMMHCVRQVYIYCHFASYFGADATHGIDIEA